MFLAPTVTFFILFLTTIRFLLIFFRVAVGCIFVERFCPYVANHCVRNVRIRGYSGPHFPAFGLNTERYDQNNSEYGHFLSSEYSKYERTEVLGNAVKNDG